MIRNLVSVIIPTYQRPQRLSEALASVAAQTYQEIEVIVVNDGGDPVEQIIREFRLGSTFPIRLVNLVENGGGSVSRNAGAANAFGEYLALLDDDDRFRPNHIFNLIGALKHDPYGTLAYNDVLIQLQDNLESASFVKIVAECRFGMPYRKQTFDIDDYIITSSCLIKHSDFQAVGGFNNSLRFCEDWDLLLRLRNRGNFVYVPDEIGIEYSFRIHAHDHTGSIFDERRFAALDYLSRTYHLPPLIPKTYYDIAIEFGFQFTSIADE